MTHHTNPSSESQTVGPEWRCWNDRFVPFKQKHRQWWNNRIGGNDEPAYILSARIVTALSEETPPQGNCRAVHRLLTVSDQRAENEFRELCEWYQTGTVGVWMDLPVIYGSLFPVKENLGFDAHKTKKAAQYLNQHLKELDPDSIRTAEDYMTAAKDLQVPVADHHHLMMGYVGFLNSHAAFIKGRNSLKEAWESFSREIRCTILSAIIMPSPFPPEQWPEATRLPDECAEFCHNLRTVLQKYELTRFVTWDLPEPQGRLRGCTAEVISNTRGPEAVVDHTPGYYPVSTRINLRDELHDSQRRHGEAAGMTNEHPLTRISPRLMSDGTFEMSGFETQFRIWLTDETVRRRYGNMRGAKARLYGALAEDFGISEERVKKHHGEYTRLVTKCGQ